MTLIENELARLIAGQTESLSLDDTRAILIELRAAIHDPRALQKLGRCALQHEGGPKVLGKSTVNRPFNFASMQTHKLAVVRTPSRAGIHQMTHKQPAMPSISGDLRRRVNQLSHAAAVLFEMRERVRLIGELQQLRAIGLPHDELARHLDAIERAGPGAVPQ